MASFKKNGTLAQFQIFNKEVYGLPDDRLYSLWDLITQMQRFAMRALKGVRKRDREKIKKNLMISLSFLTAIASRLHVDIEDETWRRFPALCSYCGEKPCICKKMRPKKRKKLKIDNELKPRTLADFQRLFNAIYPARNRTLEHAGVHLAEEIGEVSESVHNFLGQHQHKQFDNIKLEIADCISCIFGVANSADINLADELALLFRNNCHACHKAPCTCGFAVIAATET